MAVDDIAGSGKTTLFEGQGQISSPIIEGEVCLTVDSEGLSVSSPLDAFGIPYSEITSLSSADYAVRLKTAAGDLVFSKLGRDCEPFFQALSQAYRVKTLKALFVGSPAIVTAEGDYCYSEDNAGFAPDGLEQEAQGGHHPSGTGAALQGTAAVEVHEDCLCILTSDIHSRRIPFCFVSKIEKQDFKTTLHLDNGDFYKCSKLGFDTAPVNDAIEQQLRTMRKETLELVQEIDPQLSSLQAAAIAKLIPRGIAASMGDFESISPTFVSALERRIDESRAAETYQVFKEISDPLRIYCGIETAGMTMGQDMGQAPSMEDPYQMWLIAPSPNSPVCAVEFAGDKNAAAATFIYRYSGDFKAFAGQLNRALEAISFRREAIWIDGSDPSVGTSSNYAMAIQRNAALKFIRSCFAERVVHRSMDSWAEAITGIFK